MRKKNILYSVTFLLLVLSIVVYFYSPRPQNIFEEMYYETKVSYLNNNIFYRLSDVTIKNLKVFDKDMNETGNYEPVVTYKGDDWSQTELQIRFNFFQGDKGVNLLRSKEINSDLKINILIHYSVKEKY